MPQKATLTAATNDEVRAFINKTGLLEIADRMVFTFGGFQFSREIAERTEKDGEITITDTGGKSYTFLLSP